MRAQAVVDAGALLLLVAAMRVHAGSAAVQYAASWTLYSIAANSAARARLVVSAGAFAALKTNLGHAQLQERGVKLATMLRNAS
jgi:hypothetical protein